MAHVEACVEEQYNLTVLKLRGDATVDDIIGFIHEFYTESSTKLILWDGTEGSVSGISSDGFRRIAIAMRDYGRHRQGGKTAMVSGREVDYGLGRMYESLAAMEEIPCEYRTFRTIQEARDWLLGVTP